MNSLILGPAARESEPHELSMPIGFSGSRDGVLQRAYRSYHDEQDDDVPLRVSAKRKVLRNYDVPGMDQAIAICFWARSGSLLLSSYLDGHDDLLVAPMVLTSLIYPFFRDYESLSLWEMLVAYPAYFDAWYSDHRFFTGEFPISPADYYATVHALHAMYGKDRAAQTKSRLKFFQFLHAAVAVAMGRAARNPRPLIIYAQHFFDDELAKCFAEDFPNRRFIHTVRDPISALDSWYDRWFYLDTHENADRRDPWFMCTTFATVRSLLPLDRPHRGMEMCTRAVRFEDMHLAPAETMRRVSSWLGIPYQSSLVESTFNGTAYVVESNGVSWTGACPTNARRRSKNLNPVDRLLFFALLYDDFVAWDYPSPGAFRHRWLRVCIIVLLWWIVPMKMELRTTRTVLRLQVFPAIGRRQFGYAARALRFLVASRLRLMLVVAREARAHLRAGRPQLKLL